MNQSNPLSLRTLSREALIANAQALATEERRLAAELLNYLAEIQRRRLHLEMGFESLHRFCVAVLGYSDAAAHRRVSAMRTKEGVSDPAKVEAALKSGRTNLTNLASLQSFFREEKREREKAYTPEEKSALFQEIEGKSQRECERYLAERSSRPSRPERARAVAGQRTEITFSASRELMEKLEKIRSLVSHTDVASSYEALFDAMAESFLDRIDPARIQARIDQARRRRQERLAQRLTGAGVGGRSASEIQGKAGRGGETGHGGQAERNCERSRHIPAETERRVRLRDGQRCTYRDPVTQRQCEARHYLQLDHVIPFATGGESSYENLRLRCRAHNLHSAVQELGEGKIDAERIAAMMKRG